MAGWLAGWGQLFQGFHPQDGQQPQVQYDFLRWLQMSASCQVTALTWSFLCMCSVTIRHVMAEKGGQRRLGNTP